jgi:flagellar L-ring protein precursor FlgH
MKYNIIFLAFIVFLFVGCSDKQQQIDLDTKPENQYPKKMQQKETKNYKGTLYSRKGASLFADKKDLQIGDILQVNVSETLTNDSKNTRALTKTNDTSLGGGLLTPLDGVTNSEGTARRINKAKNALGVGFNSNSSNTFSGSATSKFDEEFETVISVVITQVYQNGNYFIKGSKEMLINNEKQAIAISGVIRPYDITPDNTISSAQIANLKILFEKEGDEADSVEKPWGSSLIESIWPF